MLSFYWFKWSLCTALLFSFSLWSLGSSLGLAKSPSPPGKESATGNRKKGKTTNSAGHQWKMSENVRVTKLKMDYKHPEGDPWHSNPDSTHCPQRCPWSWWVPLHGTLPGRMGGWGGFSSQCPQHAPAWDSRISCLIRIASLRKRERWPLALYFIAQCLMQAVCLLLVAFAIFGEFFMPFSST